MNTYLIAKKHQEIEKMLHFNINQLRLNEYSIENSYKTQRSLPEYAEYLEAEREATA